MRPKRKRPQNLAKKLLAIREGLGLSQGAMLRHLGLEDELERDYISKYERGVLEPPLHVLCAYADAANVFLDVLARDYLAVRRSRTKIKIKAARQGRAAFERYNNHSPDQPCVRTGGVASARRARSRARASSSGR